MPISTEWYNDDKQIILITYHGEYDWDAVYRCIRICNAMAEEVDHPVAQIIDLSCAGTLPADATAHSKRLLELRSKKIAYEVIVGANTLIKTLTNLANQVFKLFGKRAVPHFVDTLDEALSLIEAEFLKSPSSVDK